MSAAGAVIGSASLTNVSVRSISANDPDHIYINGQNVVDGTNSVYRFSTIRQEWKQQVDGIGGISAIGIDRVAVSRVTNTPLFSAWIDDTPSRESINGAQTRHEI